MMALMHVPTLKRHEIGRLQRRSSHKTLRRVEGIAAIRATKPTATITKGQAPIHGDFQRKIHRHHPNLQHARVRYPCAEVLQIESPRVESCLLNILAASTLSVFIDLFSKSFVLVLLLLQSIPETR